jgi:hypothetical protein
MRARSAVILRRERYPFMRSTRGLAPLSGAPLINPPTQLRPRGDKRQNDEAAFVARIHDAIQRWGGSSQLSRGESQAA